MITKKLTDEINARIRCETFLKRTRTGAFICPYCGKSTGPKKNRIFLLFPARNEYYCQACGSGGGPIDLYRHETGTDYQTAAAMLAHELRLPTDEIGSGPP